MDEQQDEGVLQVRAELDRLTAGGPPLGFTGADLIEAGRRQRQRRAVLGTATGLAAVVGVAVAIVVPVAALDRPGGAGVPGSDAAAGSAGTPGSSPTSGPGQGPLPAVPGLTAEQLRAIAAGCVRSFAGLAGDVGAVATPTVPPPSPGASGPTSLDRIRVYNLVRNAAGETALVYGPTVVLSCQIGSQPGPYNAGGGGLPGGLEWLPGPVSIDMLGGSSGGAVPGGKHPGQRGRYLIAGRVTHDVTRVTVTYGPDSMTVAPLNGTYLAEFVYPADWQLPTQRALQVRGYDAAGRLVGQASQLGCFITPDGRRSIGPRPGYPVRCVPAVPWR